MDTYIEASILSAVIEGDDLHASRLIGGLSHKEQVALLVRIEKMGYLLAQEMRSEHGD